MVRCRTRPRFCGATRPARWRCAHERPTCRDARCFTDQQDLTGQRDALLGLGVEADRIYVDHGLTGTKRDRPGLREALAACRAGATFVVTKLNRVARSLTDAREIGDELATRQIRVSLGGSVYDPTDAVGRLLVSTCGTLDRHVRCPAPEPEMGWCAVDVAHRLSRLGTETAFAVAATAAAWRAAGNTVYPFHLGDLNVPMASHIVEAMNAAIADGKTGYCPGAGIPPLREALADDIGSRRGTTYDPAQIVVMTGGKPVITKFLQSVMDAGKRVLYPSPGFPIYESQIEYLGGDAAPYGYVPTDDGFAIDLDQMRDLITPDTVAIIYNDLQNPISAESSTAEQEAIAALAVENDLWVLSDEAYFEMRYEGTSSSIATLPGMAERTVILYTFSKKFAMTGSRLGCAVVPAELAPIFSTLNTNDESCTTHYVQWAGIAALKGTQQPVTDMLQVLRERRDVACGLVNSIPGMHVEVPRSTFYLFPDVTEAMQLVGTTTLADFADGALRNTGVSFCTREHFGRALAGENRHYIRLAYSGIDTADIEVGLGRLKCWVESK